MHKIAGAVGKKRRNKGKSQEEKNDLSKDIEARKYKNTWKQSPVQFSKGKGTGVKVSELVR